MAEQTQRHLTIPQYVADFEIGNLEARDLVVDVVTNMRHFAAEHGVDWLDALDTVDMHFTAEREEEARDDADAA